MKELIKTPPGRHFPITIWNKEARDLIPDRFRHVLTVVLPTDYTLLMLFGIIAILIPIPVFQSVVGERYGSIWAGFLSGFALLSLIGLVFRKKFELYSSIALAFVVGLYPFFIFYLIVFEPSEINYSRVAIIFGSMIYPVLPTWRAIDIATHMRQEKQRELYLASLTGDYVQVDDD